MRGDGTRLECLHGAVDNTGEDASEDALTVLLTTTTHGEVSHRAADFELRSEEAWVVEACVDEKDAIVTRRTLQGVFQRLPRKQSAPVLLRNSSKSLQNSAKVPKPIPTHMTVFMANESVQTSNILCNDIA